MSHPHVWDYPICPDCHSDIFVDGHSGSENWICYSCESRFNGHDGSLRAQ